MSEKKGGELDQKHISDLMDHAVRQAEFVMNDCLRHACAHLGVESDHPSKGVVADELRRRIASKFEEMLPKPRDYSAEE